MRVRLIIGWVVVLSLVAAIGFAQQPPARSLALSEALDLARQNNPTYLQILNNRGTAAWGNRAALASLFTPSVSLRGSYAKSASGQQTFGSLTIPIDPYHQTAWGLNFVYQLSGMSIANRGLASAELSAADEDIANARTVLETSVRTQYLVTLEAQAQVAVARRTLERAKEQFNLAQARYTVGQGTLIDLRRAEVDTGTAAVSLLRAEQAGSTQLLLLFDLLGVSAPGATVALTDSFPVVAPAWRRDSLTSYALAENPELRSLRAREASARWGVRSATSEFLPSLNISAGYGRYTQIVETDTATLRGTDPWNIRVGISLPIFEGLNRNYRVVQARERQRDLTLQVHARELKVRSDIATAHGNLEAAYRAVGIQEANRRAAAEAFELATQRYRVGSGSYLEQLDARLAADRADADYITAVYAYHRSIAALEAAVGRTLR